MLLTVFCLRRDRSELTFSLQVDADFELQNFRALCELESGIPAAESQIVYAERPLTDNHRSLASYGLKDGDVVILQQVDNVEARPPAPLPEKFTRVLVEQQQDRARREQERIRLFSADPFDLEAQAKIEEDIRQQNIEENMTIAMEEAPESFGQVVMLYINCKVNGHPVKAFVDSGAQMTIMSQACAERCNIMRLVDRRWAGIAKGVGTQKIIGRVHLAQVQIEGDFLPCSFSILEEQPMDMLLGLDMLKRHQCSIDLKKNVLVIGTTGSQTTFLPEGELPECARLAYGAGREDLRPEEIADQELAEALQKSVEEAENRDEATTSPERPPLPTSGRPASFPDEIELRTGHPANQLLGRSASAPSLCSQAGSQAEPVNSQAAWSVDSSLECPEGPLLSPPDISDHAACATVDTPLAEEPEAGASPGPHPALQSTPDQPATSGSQEQLPAGDEAPGSPVEAAGGMFGTWSPTEDLGAAFASESLEPSQRSSLCSGPQTSDGSAQDPFPGDPNSKLTGQRQPCLTEASLSHSEGEQPFAFSAEGGSAGEGEGRWAGSVPCACPRGEAFMEVELVEEETLVVADRQEAGLPLVRAVELDCSRQAPAWAADLLSENDPTLPGSSTFGATSAASSAVSLSAASSEGQLSSLAEELCPSLTSALKELHWLLVESCRGDSREEHSCQPAGAPEEPAASQAAAGEERECPEGERLFSDSGGGEASPGMCLLESLGTQGVHRLAAMSGQEAVGLEEPLALRGPAVQSPSAASSQLEVSELPEISSPCLFSSQGPGCRVLGQNHLLSAGPPQAEDASQSAGSSAAAGLRMLSVQGPPPELSQPPPGPLALGPAAFPAEDIDRIAGSGFTPEEAGEALARAGGNADLALLILLAKNIVVPR
ncbi:uncharacterized protein [Tiliqua scincoides]|uniref:uncharacterized protein isoform X2 n=1 Tax=Tiliqua scincoides TaxID=71010 RepID=UPI003462E65A